VPPPPLGVTPYVWCSCQVFCQRCGRKTNHAKSIRFLSLPRILPVLLKRFRLADGELIKLQDAVTVPKTLDFHPYLEPRAALGTKAVPAKLFAVIEHLGSEVSSGHYVSMVEVKGGAQGKAWYLFNDKQVAPGSHVMSLVTRLSPMPGCLPGGAHSGDHGPRP
jgi:ubiquitin C-terminal hydrolase